MPAQKVQPKLLATPLQRDLADGLEDARRGGGGRKEVCSLVNIGGSLDRHIQEPPRFGVAASGLEDSNKRQDSKHGKLNRL